MEHAVAERGQIVHYLHVASACAFAYDHFTTLADEIELIWRAPWGIGKALFLASRYLAWPEFIILLYMDLLHIPESQCYGGFVYLTWSILVGIFVAQTVLILRTWAIWGGHRIVMQALASLLLTITIVNMWVVVRCTRHTHLSELPRMAGCVVVSSSKSIASAWVAISSFELLIVLMTVFKGIEHFRLGSSTLIASLYRDGIMYYIFLLSVSLANMIFVTSAPDEYIVLLAELQRAFHAILSCRIILNLRTVHARSQLTSANTEVTVSGWFGAMEQRGSVSVASSA
ncbi:hypothetical protein AURDEDRAFT_116344 [Auricularia subglabra TFB-10046 SS5]|nr:hypothetical protein AURDEDRAFT_116344 [Auricularia subglabra TFB-10046 SS5]